MLSNIGKLLFLQIPKTNIKTPLKKIVTHSGYWIRPLTQKFLITTIPLYFYTKTYQSNVVKCD
jgi:hypothetical protein